MDFFNKLNAAVARNQSLLCVGLDPNLEVMPARFSEQEAGSSIDSLRDWMQFVIAETDDLVCAYKPTLGFYQALGAPGLELLHQTLRMIPPNIPVILDAKHSDLSTSTVFAETVFETWQVDAVTLSSYVGQDLVAPFLVYSGKAVFVLCCTSNPSAVTLQEYPTPETPFYLELVKESRTWGTYEQLGLEVGARMPEALARIRAIAPERVILARDVWAGDSDLANTLAAGLNTDGEGLIIPVPAKTLSHDPRAQIQVLHEEVNQARTQVARQEVTCTVWLPDVCLLNQQPHLDLILQLYDVGCILFGDFVQASGATFPYYIDLRTIISNPQIFHKILRTYADILQGLSFDRIAGIPYGSLPTAAGLALRLNCPMIFPRKEVKAHGTRRQIEGHFQPGETVVVVDDILISGKSAMEGAAKLKAAGLSVHDIVVFIDHEEEVKDTLQANGYRGHSVLKISEITETLYQAGRISEAQFSAIAKNH